MFCKFRFKLSGRLEILTFHFKFYILPYSYSIFTVINVTVVNCLFSKILNKEQEKNFSDKKAI